jgi:hypothetical protein
MASTLEGEVGSGLLLSPTTLPGIFYRTLVQYLARALQVSVRISRLDLYFMHAMLSIDLVFERAGEKYKRTHIVFSCNDL